MQLKTMDEVFDLIIVGAGPAGITLALNLAESGLKIAILEKDVFPRKKICGDALSGQVISILKRLPGLVMDDFLVQLPKIPSHGICFTAPGGQHLSLPFNMHSGITEESAPGYICPREKFDHFLFQQLKKYPHIRTFEGKKVTAVTSNDAMVTIQTGHESFSAKVVAGADGVHSIVRCLGHDQRVGKNHYCVGIRQYYENITGLHPGHFIELLFLKELLPGYLWIFPGPDGISNVGLGMLQSDVSRKKINLSLFFHHLLSTHFLLKSRFAQARPIGMAEAQRLPLGPPGLGMSGNRYLLLGDAAFLVDPFSGEGVGNAMASAEVAARILIKCFQRNNFSKACLMEYDHAIEKRMGNDLRISAIIQKLARYPALFNFVVNKANKNENIRELFQGMYTQLEIKRKLTKPGFYLKILLG